MSTITSATDTDPNDAYRERILQLEEIEDELRLLADTDLPVAQRCRNLLSALETVRQNG